MSLARWRGHHDIQGAMDEMDRMFDRYFRRPLLRSLEEEPFDFGPAVDVYETDAEVVVKAELPGLKKEDINLTVQEDKLAITGETRQESEVSEEGYHRKEIRTGTFRRVVALPAAVRTGEITARYEDGVLTVRAPKAEVPKGTKVDIS